MFVEAGIKDKMLKYFIMALRSNWLYYFDRIRLFKAVKMPEKQFKEIKEVMESHINDFLDRTVLLGSLYIPGVKEILEPIYLQDEELTVFVRECLAFDSTLQKRTEELERKFLKPLV